MMQLLVSGFALLLAATCTDALSCKDQSGKDVDWFMVYKIPQMSDSPDTLIKTGMAFLYMDANTKKGGWNKTKVGFDQKNQAIAYTLQQVYDNLKTPDHFFMMYNDEHGTPTTEVHDKKAIGGRAHAKGTVVFNQKDGVWLIHSIPAFPPPDKYGVLEKNTKKGQSMMCITFDTSKSLGELTQQWYRSYLSVYAHSLPPEFAQKYSVLREIVADNKPTANVALSHSVKLQSKGGLQLIHFAKNAEWGQDLYADFVAPELKSNLYASTWLNTQSKDLPSGCKIPAMKQMVWNVKEVSPNKITFVTGNDHSKWAVSETSKEGFTCVGDINREVSQFKRGGGTMCFKDSNVWTAYRSIITKREKCETEIKDGDLKTENVTPITK